MVEKSNMNNVTDNQARFNNAAPTWDENPMRLLMANTIATTIQTRVSIDSTMTVVDFGCGTGLVALALQSHVHRIIGIDCSPGMLAVLDEKVRIQGITNVETHCLDLGTQPMPDMHADLIVSAMALHHIADIPALLQTLLQLLTPGGYLALADLDAEDGSFHEDKTGVHHAGIGRDWLMAHLQALGVQQLSATTAHVVERPSPDGVKRYPIFLITGQKPQTPGE